uniref:Uncharacterized protein n=1 Tax=Moschus moschiferus TaxID=68415 RepID=A0A8C6FWQ9_MOSMO
IAVQIPESDQIKQFKEFLRTSSKLKETRLLDYMQRISIKFQEYLIQHYEVLAAKATLDQPP